MKKIYLLLAFSFFSCSTENSENNPEPEADCLCYTILEANVFTIVTGNQFTAGVMSNDCTGVQKNFNRPGIYRAGDKICN
jgi:hypothetical protein